ncbi:MAG: hypothetical protein ABI528_08460, partial [bacterium]
SQLRLQLGSIVQPGSGFMIGNSLPVKIARVRLTTTSTSFTVDTANLMTDNAMELKWRNIANPFTKIWGTVNNTRTDITDSTDTYIEPNYGHFFWRETMPFENCGAKMVNIKTAVEGLYDPSLDRLNRRDTVAIELRSTKAPYPVVSSFKTRLDSINLSAFTIQTMFSFPSFPVYLVVKHHNALETWYADFVPVYGFNNYNNFDMLSSDTLAYGNNLKQVGSKYCIYSGDVNQDNVIDAADVVLTYNDVNNFASGYVITDLNGDYFTDVIDLSICYNNAIITPYTITP